MIIDRDTLDRCGLDRAGGIATAKELAGYSDTDTFGFGITGIALSARADVDVSTYGRIANRGVIPIRMDRCGLDRSVPYTRSWVELAGCSDTDIVGSGILGMPLSGYCNTTISAYGRIIEMPSSKRRDISYAILCILSSDAYINALVGGRIYRRRLPLGTALPAITVTRIDTIRNRDTNTGRYATARIQCTVFDTSAGRCEDLSDLISDRLHRLIDMYIEAGPSGAYIVRCMDAGDVTDENTDVNPVIFMNHRDFVVEYDYMR